jgi:fructose-specific phosphotransferase system IIC component
LPASYLINNEPNKCIKARAHCAHDWQIASRFASALCMALGNMKVMHSLLKLRRRSSAVKIILLPVFVAATFGYLEAASISERLLLKLGRSPEDAHFLGNFLGGLIGGLLTAAFVFWVLRHIIARLQQIDSLQDTREEDE